MALISGSSDSFNPCSGASAPPRLPGHGAVRGHPLNEYGAADKTGSPAKSPHCGGTASSSPVIAATMCETTPKVQPLGHGRGAQPLVSQ
jgi:hypothetical protein